MKEKIVRALAFALKGLSILSCVYVLMVLSAGRLAIAMREAEAEHLIRSITWILLFALACFLSAELLLKCTGFESRNKFTVQQSVLRGLTTFGIIGTSFTLSAALTFAILSWSERFDWRARVVGAALTTILGFLLFLLIRTYRRIGRPKPNHP